MSIFITSKLPMNAGQVRWLLMQTSWGRSRDIRDVAQMLVHSTVNIGAWEAENAASAAEGELVGYARVLTDWTYRAFVEDIVVDEEQRGNGIATGMVRRILEIVESVEEVTLSSEEALVPFYERLGFKPSGNRLMTLRRTPPS